METFALNEKRNCESVRDVALINVFTSIISAATDRSDCCLCSLLIRLSNSNFCVKQGAPL